MAFAANALSLERRVLYLERTSTHKLSGDFALKSHIPKGKDKYVGLWK
jgi:hypothetical protein